MLEEAAGQEGGAIAVVCALRVLLTFGALRAQDKRRALRALRALRDLAIESCYAAAQGISALLSLR